jgi:hypothetical protein
VLSNRSENTIPIEMERMIIKYEYPGLSFKSTRGILKILGVKPKYPKHLLSYLKHSPYKDS